MFTNGFGFSVPHFGKGSGSGSLTPTFDLNFLAGAFDPRITFSRTSNATQFDATGTLVYAPHNLLTYSEQFDNAAWTKTRSTISSNLVAAPDGTLTADKLVEDTSAATSHFTQSVIVTPQPNTQHAGSIYVKAGERRYIAITMTGGGGADRGVFFDAQTGTYTGVFAGGLPYTITAVGNGWFRYTLNDTTTAAAAYALRVYLCDTANNITYTGDGTSGVYVWGAQLNVGALQPYYSTTAKNLLGFTQEFENAYWSKVGSTVTQNAVTAPDGFVNADKLVEDTSTGGHYLTPTGVAFTVGQVITYSVYLKAAERTFAQLILTGIGPAGGNLVAGFNLSTGVAGTPSTGVTSRITSVGNGWYRCSMTYTVATAASANRQIRISQSTSTTPSSYTGDGTSGIYIWGAQFNDSASLDPYVYNPTTAPSAVAYYGPRRDYDPTTLAARGFFVEEASTNLHKYSEDLTQWGTPSGASVSSNVAVAPDGNTTADKLVEDTSNGGHFLSAGSLTYSYTSGVSYTRSCFLKAAGRNIVTIYLPGAAFPSSGRQALFNLSNGTVYSVESGVTATIQTLPNGWYRCAITATANVTGSGNSGGSALTDNGTASYQGDGVSGVLIWGAQLELTVPYATSYIPTAAATVARAADVAPVLGANFSNWYNQTQGAILIQAATYVPTAAATSRVAVSIGDSSTFNESMYLSKATTTANFTANVIDGGVAQWASNTLGNITTNTAFKASFGYALNNLGGSLNAAAVVTDNVATIPTPNSLMLGNGSWSGALNYFNGWIQRVSYFPRRISDAELVGITK